MNLSAEVDRHKRNKDNILTYTKRCGIIKIPEYCSNAGLPLCVVWYFIQEEFDEYREEAQSELKRICKFYDLRIDIELRTDSKTVETDE